MQVLGRFEIKMPWDKKAEETTRAVTDLATKIKAEFTGYGNGNGFYRTLWSWTFNGEKNLGEAGPIKNYRIDYEALRTRSWQAYLENELAQTTLKKFTKWVIGKGLKLQAEPAVDVLESEGITIDREAFNEVVEARFSLYADSRRSDYAGMTSLQNLQKKAHKNAIIGGDVLVILRVDEYNCVTTQLIDGSHVMNPLNIGKDVIYWNGASENGNRIENGIELSSTNEHIAFFVRKPGPFGYSIETQRVSARSKKTGLIQAYLVYGSEFRVDNMRGLPIIASVIETLKKLDRYKEATVATAEELAKVTFQIVHKPESTGESPLTQQLAKAHDADAIADLPVDVDGRELANTVAATTNKTTYNNPIGAEIKTVNPNKYQLYFKDFYTVNAEQICAAIGMPPDVAFSKYNSNYSASRAAIKDWEHTLNVDRDDFAKQFLRPIFELWLVVEILSNKINAPGYLEAWIGKNKNYMVIAAYTKARWVGAPVPHIDPVKEVQAERMKLGATGASLPLTTLEAATEALNGGESDANMEQYSQELEESKSLKIELPEPEIKPGKKSDKPAA